MNAQFGSLSDEFNASLRLVLKLDLAPSRETVLHYFEQIRKAFPGMTRFRRRDEDCLILEDPAEARGSRRWVRLDSHSLRIGFHTPEEASEVRRLAEVTLDQGTYHLGLSTLDFDHLEVIYGFDLEYRGNHDQLVADTFWADHPLYAFLTGDHAHHAIDAEPYLGIALTPDCDLQAYTEIKSRTNTYEIRSGEFDAQPLTVYLIVRKYWGVGEDRPILDTQRLLFDYADDLATDKVVPLLVNPLAQAIASRS